MDPSCTSRGSYHQLQYALDPNTWVEKELVRGENGGKGGERGETEDKGRWNGEIAGREGRGGRWRWRGGGRKWGTDGGKGKQDEDRKVHMRRFRGEEEGGAWFGTVIVSMETEALWQPQTMFDKLSLKSGRNNSSTKQLTKEKVITATKINGHYGDGSVLSATNKQCWIDAVFVNTAISNWLKLSPTIKNIATQHDWVWPLQMKTNPRIGT